MTKILLILAGAALLPLAFIPMNVTVHPTIKRVCETAFYVLALAGGISFLIERIRRRES